MQNSYNKVHTARTHEESRKVVCCCCGRKVKEQKGKSSIKVIDEKISFLVVKYVHSDYSVDNICYPTAICPTCRLSLASVEKVTFIYILVFLNYYDCYFQNPENPGRKLPPLLNYKDLVPPLPNTRQNTDIPCPCTICNIARLKNQDYIGFKNEHSNKTGRPAEGEKGPSPKALKMCSECLSELAPGKTHNCDKTTKRLNMINLVKNSSFNTKSTVITSELKSLAASDGKSSKCAEIDLKSGSKVLPIRFGTQRANPKVPMFSHKNLKRPGTSLNLSYNSVM